MDFARFVARIFPVLKVVRKRGDTGGHKDEIRQVLDRELCFQ